MSNTREKVVNNLIWRLAERYGAQLVQFVVSIVLARILLPEIYGTVALITVFITILQVFIDSGFGNALIQKKDADDLDFSTVFYFNVVICLILYLIVFFCAPLIAKFYENSQLTILIRVLSITIIFSSLKNVQQAYVSKQMQFKKFFMATIIGTIISAVVGIYMALTGYGVWAIIAQNLINVSIDTTVLWIIVKWRPKKMFSFTRLKYLFNFGWKLLVTSLIDVVYNNLRQIIIGKKYSSSDLAHYNKANQFPNIIVTGINLSIDSALFPVLSNAQDDKNRVKEMMRRSIKTASFLIAPLMIGLCVTAYPVVKLVLSDSWLSIVPYLQIFCITYFFYPIQSAYANSLKAIGRSGAILKVEIIKKIIGITSLFATLWFGVKAIAFSLLLTSILSTIIDAIQSRIVFKYKFSEQLVDIIPSLLLATFMGVCVSLLYYIKFNYIVLLFIQIILGALIYIGASALFKFDSFNYLFSILKDKLNNSKIVKKMHKDNLTIINPSESFDIKKWQLISSSDICIIDDTKLSALKNFKLLYDSKYANFTYSFKLKMPKTKKNIVEIKSDYKNTILDNIKSNYYDAPYFEEVYPVVNSFVLNEEKLLNKFILNYLETIARYLDIKTNFYLLSDIKTSNKNGLEIELCKHFNANYIDIDKTKTNVKSFKKNKIKYRVLVSKYNTQLVSDKLINNNSIIDILMYNSKNYIKMLLTNKAYSKK